MKKIRLKKIIGLLLFFFVVFGGAYFLLSKINDRTRSFTAFRMKETPDSRLRGNDRATGNDTPGFEYQKVVKVVDGDTVKLENGETVRYIGMDAPEVWELDAKTNKWNKTDKCFAEEALVKNKELVEGKVVRLEKETSNTDRYGRLLRDVWVDSCHPEASDEGSREILRFAQNDTCFKFINLELVKEGFATAMTIKPDIKYQTEILAAQKEAKEGKRGLWGVCN